MTAFVPANLPSGVGTVEELVAWGGSVLAQVNAATQIQTSAGQTEPVCAVQTFRFPFLTVAPERLIVVAYLPLTAGWRTGGKLWNQGVAEISVTAIPTEYTTN